MTLSLVPIYLVAAAIFLWSPITYLVRTYVDSSFGVDHYFGLVIAATLSYVLLWAVDGCNSDYGADTWSDPITWAPEVWLLFVGAALGSLIVHVLIQPR